jgi:hypothetical protein
MKKLFFAIGILFLAGRMALSDISAVLDNGVGARGAAMGFSQVADVKGVEGIYWNPAALAGMNSVHISTYASEIYGTNYKTLGIAFPAWGGSWGILALNAAQPGFQATELDINGRPVPSGALIGYGANAYYLSYARLIGHLYLGASLKYLSEYLADKGSAGLGLDIGLFASPSSNFSVGAKVENVIVPNMKWDTESEEVPTIKRNLRVGVSVLTLKEKLLLSGDIDFKEGERPALFVGGEYRFLEIFSLRGGVFAERPTFGLGMRGYNMTVDYSYVKGNDYLEDSQRISLCFTFDLDETNYSSQVLACK